MNVISNKSENSHFNNKNVSSSQPSFPTQNVYFDHRFTNWFTSRSTFKEQKPTVRHADLQGHVNLQMYLAGDVIAIRNRKENNSFPSGNVRHTAVYGGSKSHVWWAAELLQVQAQLEILLLAAKGAPASAPPPHLMSLYSFCLYSPPPPPRKDCYSVLLFLGVTWVVPWTTELHRQ